MIIMVAFSAYLMLALWSYNPADSGFSVSQGINPVTNQAGALGAWWSDMLFTWFGWVAFLLPLIMLGYSIGHFLRLRCEVGSLLLLVRVLALILLIVGACTLATLHVSNAIWELPKTSGGLVGYWLGRPLVVDLLKMSGINLLAITLVLLGITLYGNLNWGAIAEQVGRIVVILWRQGWYSLSGGHTPAAVVKTPLKKKPNRAFFATLCSSERL